MLTKEGYATDLEYHPQRKRYDISLMEMFTEIHPPGIDGNAVKEMISCKNRCCANEFQLLSGHIGTWNLLSEENIKYRVTVLGKWSFVCG